MIRRLSVAALLALAASCGSDGPGFVLVTFQRGDAPAETTHIDLTAKLGDQMATVPIENGDGTPIDFPKTKSLEVANGSGTLSLTAIARDANGVDVGHGEATTTVARNAVASATITFAKRNVLRVVAENRGIGSGIVTVSPGGGTCANETCDFDFY